MNELLNWLPALLGGAFVAGVFLHLVGRHRALAFQIAELQEWKALYENRPQTFRLVSGFLATLTLALPAIGAEPSPDARFTIEVYSQSGCAYCVQLARDLKGQQLKPIADWANVKTITLAKDSATFAQNSVRTTPTIIVRPPAKGTFGDSAATAFRVDGYDGNARKLAGEMRVALAKWAKEHEVRP